MLPSKSKRQRKREQREALRRFFVDQQAKFPVTYGPLEGALPKPWGAFPDAQLCGRGFRVIAPSVVAYEPFRAFDTITFNAQIVDFSRIDDGPETLSVSLVTAECFEIRSNGGNSELPWIVARAPRRSSPPATASLGGVDELVRDAFDRMGKALADSRDRRRGEIVGGPIAEKTIIEAPAEGQRIVIEEMEPNLAAMGIDITYSLVDKDGRRLRADRATVTEGRAEAIRAEQLYRAGWNGPDEDEPKLETWDAIARSQSPLFRASLAAPPDKVTREYQQFQQFREAFAREAAQARSNAELQREWGLALRNDVQVQAEGGNTERAFLLWWRRRFLAASGSGTPPAGEPATKPPPRINVEPKRRYREE